MSKEPIQAYPCTGRCPAEVPKATKESKAKKEAAVQQFEFVKHNK